MALGDPYISRDEFKARMGDTTAIDDTRIDDAVIAATRSIELATGRQFNKTDTATARTFAVTNGCHAKVDDFWTTSGLIIETDTGDDGTFATDWTASDYELEPLNGIVAGQTGWPYYRINAVGSYRFPTCNRRKGVLRVTAPWGWDATPKSIKEAAFLLAEEIIKLKDAPFGVAGFGTFGDIRVRENPKIRNLIQPYMRSEQIVMVA